MRWLDETLSYLLPDALVDGTPWKKQWASQQKEAYVRSCQIAFLLIAVGYVANFFLFDIPMQLSPLGYWAFFRGVMVLLSLSTFLFYRSSLVTSSLYKLPGITMAFLFCYSQAWVTVFYGREAWVFFFFFVMFSCILLRLTSFQALLWSAFVISISTPVLVSGSVGMQNIMSGAIVSTLSSVIIRSAALAEVRLFLANQQHDQAQQQLVDLTANYADRIKTFIPKVIANRLTVLMEEQRMNVVEASVEALKSRKRVVSCLFTDIRGFTQSSKDLDGFVANSVLPEVATCSEIIEEHEGIPRKIGDLIFAYFDDESISNNALRSFKSAYEIARANESMNASNSKNKIRRYTLISLGEAVVGNFGGLDSSIEITALGSPVNYLSRVDELTKHPNLAKHLKPGDVIYDKSTHDVLCHIGCSVDHEMIQLEKFGLSIRDFPEVDAIYLHTPNDETYDYLNRFIAS